MTFLEEERESCKVGKWKDQDEESSREEEEEGLEEVSANKADEKDEGELPIQGTNEDEDEEWWR